MSLPSRKIAKLFSIIELTRVNKDAHQPSIAAYLYCKKPLPQSLYKEEAAHGWAEGVGINGGTHDKATTQLNHDLESSLELHCLVFDKR